MTRDGIVLCNTVSFLTSWFLYDLHDRLCAAFYGMTGIPESGMIHLQIHIIGMQRAGFFLYLSFYNASKNDRIRQREPMVLRKYVVFDQAGEEPLSSAFDRYRFFLFVHSLHQWCELTFYSLVQMCPVDGLFMQPFWMADECIEAFQK